MKNMPEVGRIHSAIPTGRDHDILALTPPWHNPLAQRDLDKLEHVKGGLSQVASHRASPVAASSRSTQL